MFLTVARVVEQAEGGKTVAVDSTVITARQFQCIDLLA